MERLSQFNEDVSRTALKRQDVSKGLRRIEAKHIPVCEHSAPIFAIAFDMLDKTALPELTRKAIWAINNASACVEKGEEGMFIKGIAGLHCLMGNREKTTIQRQDGETGEMQIVKEINMQVRIHVAQSGDIVEHYAFLVVCSPLAFSLRKAVWNTLHTRGRGLDGQNADMRRACWNRLATHVRQGFVPSARQSSHNFSAQERAGVVNMGMAGKYTDREMSQAHDSSVDWVRVSNAESFTCLFNVQRAVDWVCKHFFLQHSDVDQMTLEGFGIMNRDSEHITPQFISQCKKYDEDVEHGITETYKKKKKKKKRKSASKGAQPTEEESEEEEVGEEQEIFISIPSPYQGEVQNEDDDEVPMPGYPECLIGMEVNMSKSIEVFPSYDVFWSECKGFPTSVTLDILKKSLDMDIEEEEGAEEYLTLLESDMIMKGETPIFKRPMLSGGDGVWGEQCKGSLLRLEGDGRTRWEYQRKFVRLAFALGLTRAGGSDVYDNKRVEAYGKFMALRDESVQECKKCYEKSKEVLRGRRLGCCMYEAMALYTQTMYELNHNVWHLRPDNLFLVQHLAVSDVMLCLDYFDSTIGGASNGIGATVIVHDGGGSYHVFLRKESEGGHTEGSVNMGQVLRKKNGSGADMCVGIYKMQVNMSAYSPRCSSNVEGFVELKRTTELGLLQDCCNVIENPNTECARQIHTVRDTCSRKFSTELKAGNDATSMACMQAIAWLVTRNTTGLDSNCFATTKENEKTKTRTSVEYRQVTFGYWMICSNIVGHMSRERFKTLLTVSRSVCSCANAMSYMEEEEDTMDACVQTCHQRDGTSFQSGRCVFFSNMCTCVVSAFLQWTGVLGRLPASPVLEAILDVFYMQLGLCKDLLNPDSYVQGERGRCFQISKARGVAMSLMLMSMEHTLEAGRKGQGQQEAVENTAQRLMVESTSPHIASWIMADTLEHMFRMDFMLLMQMLATKLDVPRELNLADVLRWLETGDTGHCVILREWLQQKRRLEHAPLDRRVGCTEVEACFYLTHEDLKTHVVNAQGQVDSTVCSHVGSRLFFDFKETLRENCQIHASHNGEEIVQCMLFGNVNTEMRWPSVFGTRETLPHFWLGREPANEQTRRKLVLYPIRVVVTDAREAALFVDARWLLLFCGMCGRIPSQSSRFLCVGKWVEHFFQQCVPDRMVCSRWLFTGLPHPVMDWGMLQMPHCDSGRRVLRRGGGGAGLNAPIRTGVVEDLGAAALRYQLAAALQVSERSIPTEAVSYSFAPGKWHPIKLEDGGFGALKWDEGDRFVLKMPGYSERIVSADNAEFLNGRVSEPIRPLYMVDRPGVVICMGDQLGLVEEYSVEEGAYKVWNGETTVYVDAYATEDALVPVGGKLFLKVEALEGHETFMFKNGEDRVEGVEYVECWLQLMEEEQRKVMVKVPMERLEPGGHRFVLYGASHGQVGGRKAMSEAYVDVEMLRTKECGSVATRILF